MMAMNVAEKESIQSAVGKFDINGEVYASVYVYESNVATPSPQNVIDSNLAIELLKKTCKCKIISEDEAPDEMEEMEVVGEDDSWNDNSDDEGQCEVRVIRQPEKHHNKLVIVNQQLKHTVDHWKDIASKKHDARCFILYFIVKQVGSKFMTNDNKELEVLQLWKKIQAPSIPVIFFIQGNLTGEAEITSVLLNSDKKGGPKSTIAQSANVLLIYLPNPGNLNEPVPKILGDELRKNLDIHTSLTNVNRMLTAATNATTTKSCIPRPKFSSTLINHLYLMKGEPVGVPGNTSEEVYSHGGKYLAIAFLFGEYTAELNLTTLSSLIGDDKESLNTLKDFGVELMFCVDNGYMTKANFEMKLDEILKKEDLNIYDGIFIVVSTHGWENLILFASDDWFTVDFIWHKLALCPKLKDKPKVIICDACRGKYSEGTMLNAMKTCKGETNGPITFKESGIVPKNQTPMDDILIALATVEGKKAYPGKKGSAFIYNLCETFKNHGELDFLTILTITMNAVSVDNCHKQQITFTSALQKLLYFPKRRN